MNEKERMNKTRNLIAIISILVISGAVYYTYVIKSTTPQYTQITAATPNQISPQSQVKEFTITGQNFSFTPNKITVNKGDTVKITFKNNEGMHDFVIDQFNVRTNLVKAGGQQTIQFIADTAGVFEFYCSVGSHRQMGMKGSLEVM